MSERPDDLLRGRITFDGSRTPLKTTLFVLVCLAWLVPGLVGHDPWKTDEAIVFGSVAEMLRTGDWVAFRIAGEPFVHSAPLFLWVAAALAKAFGGFLPLHDAARLASGFFMAATLAALSAASLELLGERAMRVAVLVFIGCLGLLIRAHEMSTDLAGLPGIALAIHGLAVALRRPRLGGAIAGAGMGLAFLADGLLPLSLLAALLVALPAASPAWRNARHARTVAIAVACAAPLAAIWPVALASAGHGALALWWSEASASRWSEPFGFSTVTDLFYFAKILPWYAWPALPLAAWTLWRARRTLASRPPLQLPLIAFGVFFAGLSLFADSRELNALPLLVPLSLLAVAELDALPRGGASALDWFGMSTFFLFALLIWVGWVAAVTGRPHSVAAWLAAEVPGFHYRFDFLSFALAALLTLVWLAVAARSLRSTRRAIVNWTAGITMVWVLVMTLGVPLVDAARSYRGLAAQVAGAIPRDAGCVARLNLGDAQRALLDYFAKVETVAADRPEAARCRVLLVQAIANRYPPPTPGWTEYWRGARPGDEHEVFILLQRDR